MKDNLPIFGIPKAKQLADFCTSQRDVSRGISRMPLILSRIYEEDTEFKKPNTPNYKISPMSQAPKIEPADADKLIDNLNSTIQHRNTAQRDY